MTSKHVSDYEFGRCKCGARLPEQVNDCEGAHIVHAEHKDTAVKFIMGEAPKHDLIEYFHAGDWWFTEIRTRGECANQA
jgi:hypothetical protein